MIKLILTIVLFSCSFFLSAEAPTTVDKVPNAGSTESTQLILDTADDSSQYVEIGFTNTELKDNDFSTPVQNIDGSKGITLKSSTDGTASYGGDDNNLLYVYYRVHHTGKVTITIKTEALTRENSGSGDTTPSLTIDNIVSGNKNDESSTPFSSGGIDETVTYSPAEIYYQNSATSPVADSIRLTVNTENFLDKPSGIYKGAITLTVTTDSGVAG